MTTDEAFERCGFMAALVCRWKQTWLSFLYFSCLTNLPVLLPLYAHFSRDNENEWTSTTAAAVPINSGVLWVTFGYCCYWSLFFAIMLVMSLIGTPPLQSISLSLSLINLTNSVDAVDFFYWRNRQMTQVPLAMHHALKITNIFPTDMTDESRVIKAFGDTPPDLVQFVWQSHSLASVNKKIAALDEALEYIHEEGNDFKVRPNRCCLPGICTCVRKRPASELLHHRRDKVPKCT